MNDEKNDSADKLMSASAATVVLIVLIAAVLHTCVDAIDQQQDPAGELNRRNRAEIMQRTGYEEAQHLDVADGYLTARVERNWGEVK